MNPVWAASAILRSDRGRRRVFLIVVSALLTLLLGLGIIMWAVAQLVSSIVSPGNSAGIQLMQSTCGGLADGDSAVVASGSSGADAEQLGLPGVTAEDRKKALANAEAIVAVGVSLRVPEQGHVVAIAAALQESKLQNLQGGDRDSEGLFQQRPSTGWGSSAQVTNPTLATRAFYGRADHTNNPGLLDIAGWESWTVTRAAQAVQRSAYPTLYADDEPLARRIVAAVLPAATNNAGSAAGAAATPAVGTAPATTPATPSSPASTPTSPVRVISANIRSGVSDARYLLDLRRAASRNPDFIALQEADKKSRQVITPPGYSAHRAESNQALRETPVLWNTDRWRMVESGSQMTSVNQLKWGTRGVNWVTAQRTDGGQVVSVVSVHNLVGGLPRNPALYREYGEAMRVLQQLTTTLAARGAVILAGDYNIDYRSDRRQQLVNWPRAQFAKVGVKTTFDQLGPLATGDRGGMIDYVWYRGLTPTRQGVYEQASDHRGLWVDFSLTAAGEEPIATAPVAECEGAPEATECPASKWPQLESGLTPDGVLVLRCMSRQFPEITSYGGLGSRSNNPGSSHGSGRAVDAMIPNYQSSQGVAYGDSVAAWVQENARALGVSYVIWNARIWSVDRADEGWRPYSHPSGAGGDTLLHRDHVHVDVEGTAATGMGAGAAAGAAPAAGSGGWVVPVGGGYRNTARFGQCGSLWSSCHTGLDFAPNQPNTRSLAAAAGVVKEITTSGWGGNMTKIDHGGGVETWYAHQASIGVRVGQRVQPGQPIGVIGTTGNSTGVHLHLEVRVRGQAKNPSEFLPRRA